MGTLIPNDGAPIAEVTLRGRRVRLEPLRESHLDALLAAAQHESERFPFTFMHQDREGMKRYLEQALDQARRGQALPFATVDEDAGPFGSGGQVVGSTRFGNLEFWDWRDQKPRPPRNPDAVEIGWTWLAPRVQRSAINTEAKLLMLGHAFEVWKVSRVTLKTDARNQRSRAAIERIGAKLDGVLRAHMPASDGGIRDTAFFSMRDSEWPEAKKALLARLERGEGKPNR